MSCFAIPLDHQFTGWVDGTELPEKRFQLSAIKAVLARVPTTHYELLKHIAYFLSLFKASQRWSVHPNCQLLQLPQHSRPACALPGTHLLIRSVDGRNKANFRQLVETFTPFMIPPNPVIHTIQVLQEADSCVTGEPRGGWTSDPPS